VNRIISEYGTSISPALLRAVLSNYALQFICKKNCREATGNVLVEYLRGNLDVGIFDILIRDLLGDTSDIDLSSDVFETTAKYVANEDTLGFVYISFMNIGVRKASGTYYTPYKVVNSLVSHLAKAIDISGKSIFDPCCGSGNFLLAIGEQTDTPEMIYGQDIDLVAVKLARISFALKYDITDVDFLFTHFTCADTLSTFYDKSFDIIVGNPPWGGELTKEQIRSLAMYYHTVVKNGTETYNLFTERSLSMLSENGILAFVLPEAILNVAAHRTIRSILIEKCNFKFACYLGNVFSGVQCPAIILGVEKSSYKTHGVSEVSVNGEYYHINSNRQVSVDRLNFHVKDEQQDCLDTLVNSPQFNTLLNNAKFALGIVTGNNAAYISDVCHEGYEPVLKGSDVKKFRFEESGNYIRFIPQSFQQVAPTDLYRAPEKLLYRFICETLVFAYDNQQTLSLNSCNILVPQIPGMATKYVLAVLNSRAASFFFTYMFNSVKVLRSQIEQIPIPAASDSEQEQIIGLVDKLINGDAKKPNVYNELDDLVMCLYGLSSTAKQTIRTSLSYKNLFLV
jgi:predicted RNA methylase